VVTIGGDYVITVAANELGAGPEGDEPTQATGPAGDERAEEPSDRHEP